MALYKEVRQNDGVTTKYHRILYVMQSINRNSSIAVLSYVDEAARSDEKNYVIAQPYSSAATYEAAYMPDLTVEAAYEYLKTLPDFEGATDI